MPYLFSAARIARASFLAWLLRVPPFLMETSELPIKVPPALACVRQRSTPNVDRFVPLHSMKTSSYLPGQLGYRYTDDHSRCPARRTLRTSFPLNTTVSCQSKTFSISQRHFTHPLSLLELPLFVQMSSCPLRAQFRCHLRIPYSLPAVRRRLQIVRVLTASELPTIHWAWMQLRGVFVFRCCPTVPYHHLVHLVQFVVRRDPCPLTKSQSNSERAPRQPDGPSRSFPTYRKGNATSIIDNQCRRSAETSSMTNDDHVDRSLVSSA